MRKIPSILRWSLCCGLRARSARRTIAHSHGLWFAPQSCVPAAPSPQRQPRPHSAPALIMACPREQMLLHEFCIVCFTFHICNFFMFVLAVIECVPPAQNNPLLRRHASYAMFSSGEHGTATGGALWARTSPGKRPAAGRVHRWCACVLCVVVMFERGWEGSSACVW